MRRSPNARGGLRLWRRLNRCDMFDFLEIVVNIPWLSEEPRQRRWEVIGLKLGLVVAALGGLLTILTWIST